MQGVRGRRVGVWVCLPEGVTQAVTGTPLTEKASVKPKKPLENEKRTRKRRATAGRKEPKSDYLAACVPPAHLAACEDPVWSLIAVSPAVSIGNLVQNRKLVRAREKVTGR